MVFKGGWQLIGEFIPQGSDYIADQAAEKECVALTGDHAAWSGKFRKSVLSSFYLLLTFGRDVLKNPSYIVRTYVKCSWNCSIFSQLHDVVYKSKQIIHMLLPFPGKFGAELPQRFPIECTLPCASGKCSVFESTSKRNNNLRAGFYTQTPTEQGDGQRAEYKAALHGSPWVTTCCAYYIHSNGYHW